jgi:hypothetical protein
MSRLIDVGCRVAAAHHRYHQVHGALFGAASFRLIIDVLSGRRRQAYRQHLETLAGVRRDLAAFKTEIAMLDQAGPPKSGEREIQRVLLDYTSVLDRAIVGLSEILGNLERDESAYRETGSDGRSGFTRDKLRYDHSLLELERLGTRLNRLFSNY